MKLNSEDERRHTMRYRMSDGAFAFIDNTPFTIQNISEGGMMLQSVVFDEAPPEHLKLDIFLKNEEFYLKDIPVRLISELKSKATTPFSAIQVKRFGLAFDNLNRQQKELLYTLIMNNTNGEA